MMVRTWRISSGLPFLKKRRRPSDALKALQAHPFPVMRNDWTVHGFEQQAPAVGGDIGSVRMTETPVESPASPMRSDLMIAFAKAVHATHPGVPLVPHMEVGGSDGAIFRANGIPTYGVQGIFIKLSEDFEHGLNERVPVSALSYGLQHWYTLLRTLGER
jgi:acetylornithine deacetylase/succinyl-diaminopimelate desuccinylase-like protein